MGFLNLNIKECSGNQGLKDIILSLKWLKENIHNFNGDPNNVTLFGSSSGGCAINLLMLSPAAKDLFHKAVMSSPTYTLLVYAEYQDDNETVAFRLGHMLGFRGSDRYKLLNFFKRIPPEVLTTRQRDYDKLFGELIAPVFPHSTFLPTVDAASETPIIPISPKKLIHSITPIPLILGICERESIMGFSTERTRTLTEKNYKTAYRQNQWSWMYDLSEDEMKMLNHQVERFYLKDSSFQDAPLSIKVDMLTEIAFHDLYDKLINPIAEKLPSSVYLYRYRFEGDISVLKVYLSHVMNEKISGSLHICDYACWNNVCQELSERNVQMIKTYTKLITTFTKNCDPNYQQLRVRWRPTTVENPCYLCVNDELQMVTGEFFQQSIEFWKRIKKQFEKN